MAFTYTWEVTGLRKRNSVNKDGEALPGAIVQTYWKCVGVNEDGEEATFSGATPFSAENVAAGDFVPFEQLTEETVLGWIKDYVHADPTYWEHIQERIFKEIDQRQVEDATIPWAKVEEEVTPAPPEDVSVPPPGESPDEPEEDTVNTANTAE